MNNVQRSNQIRKKRNKNKDVRTGVFVLLVLFIVSMIGGIIGERIFSVFSGDAESFHSSALPQYGTRDGKNISMEIDSEYDISCNFVSIQCELSEDVQEFLYYLCQANYIDFHFVMALIYTESSFDVSAVSKTNDTGLMQINAVNHEWLSRKLGITDFTDPYQNIYAGVFILRSLFEKYDNASMVCMAYNLGEYGAGILWKENIYETAYSRKILAKADEYTLKRGVAENGND